MQNSIQPSTGGLFGSNQPGTQGGMFSQPPTQSGGLFSGAGINQPVGAPNAGGGLFGTAGPTLASQPGGLFGPPTTPTPVAPVQQTYQAPAAPNGYYPMMDPTSLLMAMFQLQQLLPQQNKAE